jgi:hypothetical protein
MGQYKKALSAASYARLPKVRSTAKPLLHKVSNNIVEDVEPHFKDGRMLEPRRKDKIYMPRPEERPQTPDASDDSQLPKLIAVSQPDQSAPPAAPNLPSQPVNPATGLGGLQADSPQRQPLRQPAPEPPLAEEKTDVIRSSVKFRRTEGSSPVLPQLTASNLNLQYKRDELKRLKQREEERASNDNLRGMYLIDEDLKTLTKGKGWAPNIRARNYLKAHTGGLAGGGQSEAQAGEQVSAHLQQRRENRSKGRAELHHWLTQSRSRGRQEDKKSRFGTIDEEGEKRRKRRLLLISKGINPDDPQAEEKLRAVLEREEYEDNNVFEKCTPRSPRQEEEGRPGRGRASARRRSPCSPSGSPKASRSARGFKTSPASRSETRRSSRPRRGNQQPTHRPPRRRSSAWARHRR